MKTYGEKVVLRNWTKGNKALGSTYDWWVRVYTPKEGADPTAANTDRYDVLEYTGNESTEELAWKEANSVYDTAMGEQ